MIDREKFLEQKRKEIQEVCKEQIRLTKKAANLAGKVYKTMPARMRNLGKVMVICFQIRSLEIQKQIIISQPIPKKEFPSGGIMGNGPAIVGGTGKEVFLPLNKLQH
jgi:hypothetical protein